MLPQPWFSGRNNAKGRSLAPPGMVFYLYHYRLLCIKFLITGETHSNAIKLGGHPMHLGNVDSWHHFRSSRLLPDRLPSDVPQWLIELFTFQLFYGFNARWWSIGSSTNARRCRYQLRGKLRWRHLNAWLPSWRDRALDTESLKNALGDKKYASLYELVRYL